MSDEENNKNSTQQDKKETFINGKEVACNPNTIIPKLCTSIGMAAMRNKNIVMTMTYDEPQSSSHVIERIVIDLEHAESLNNALTKILEDFKNDTTKSE